MKRFAFVVVATGVAGCAVVWAQGQSGKKEAKFVSADKAVFEQVVPGASRATLWGNPNTGPHGAFTKFVASTRACTPTRTTCGSS
jgi:hypothetical protein